jgi:hypothetical protein
MGWAEVISATGANGAGERPGGKTGKTGSYKKYIKGEKQKI